MKLMEKLRKKKLGNKGFSLVEMIIVIAIMAILVGIVGTQVTPYLNSARVEKDKQILSSIATASVTFYSLHSEEFAEAEGRADGQIILNLNTKNRSSIPGTLSYARGADKWFEDLSQLTGYASLDDLKLDMTSADGRSLTNVYIIYNFHEDKDDPITTIGGYDAPAGYVTVIAISGSKYVLEPVKVRIATTTP